VLAARALVLAARALGRAKADPSSPQKAQPLLVMTAGGLATAVP